MDQMFLCNTLHQKSAKTYLVEAGMLTEILKALRTFTKGCVSFSTAAPAMLYQVTQPFQRVVDVWLRSAPRWEVLGTLQGKGRTGEEILSELVPDIGECANEFVSNFEEFKDNTELLVAFVKTLSSDSDTGDEESALESVSLGSPLTEADRDFAGEIALLKTAVETMLEDGKGFTYLLSSVTTLWAFISKLSSNRDVVETLKKLDSPSGGGNGFDVVSGVAIAIKNMREELAARIKRMRPVLLAYVDLAGNKKAIKKANKKVMKSVQRSEDDPEDWEREDDEDGDDRDYEYATNYAKDVKMY